MDEDYTEWCKNLFASLAEGGAWAVPRSGLIFRRQGDRLVLTSASPYLGDSSDPDMPEMWRAHQYTDFVLTRNRFAKAGIDVVMDDKAFS